VRKALLGALICCVLLAGALAAGPLTSGALLLLLPTGEAPVDHDLPSSYQPLHKGHIDLGTGLYIRQNEDLVVRGTPALILRRTYLSGYRVSRHFGVGTTHDGEWYLIGDAERFQWVELILANGARVRFERTSRGSSYSNAMFEHRVTSGMWNGARLGWAGIGWVMRLRDGSVVTFQDCGPDSKRECSITRARDRDGHTIEYRRDADGRLLRMEAGDRWIAFDYDRQNRIARAHDSTGHQAVYEYDARGRLSLVTATGGLVHRYTYTVVDEMATIAEPGTSIENVYNDHGRCIRQVNRFADTPEPYVFEFDYRLASGGVVQTDTTRSDGTWTKYTFNRNRFATSETWGREGVQPAVFTYEREPNTNAMTSLTLTCPDRSGRPLRHSSAVSEGNEEWIKWDLLRTNCSWTGSRWRRVE
jgi:YD repeat-containing protein